MAKLIQFRIGGWFVVIFMCGFLTGSFIHAPTIRKSSQNVKEKQQPIKKAIFRLLPQYANRDDLQNLLVLEGFTTGAEVGVRNGIYSETLLKNWKNCTEYHAIDLWAHQKHYHDGANVEDSQQQLVYQEARKRLERFERIIHYHRNYSNLAVKEIPDDSLDFIYIDARHDYVGVMEDLVLYWPKLKVNGVFAGHDYLDLDEVKARDPTQEWGVDHRGVKRTDNKAVKSAVIEFATKHQRQILVTLPELWPTWYFRK